MCGCVGCLGWGVALAALLVLGALAPAAIFLLVLVMLILYGWTRITW